VASYFRDESKSFRALSKLIFCAVFCDCFFLFRYLKYFVRFLDKVLSKCQTPARTLFRRLTATRNFIHGSHRKIIVYLCSVVLHVHTLTTKINFCAQRFKCLVCLLHPCQHTKLIENWLRCPKTKPKKKKQ